MSNRGQEELLKKVNEDLKQNSTVFKKYQDAQQTALVLKEEEFVKHTTMQLYFYVEPAVGPGQKIKGEDVGDGKQQLNQDQLGQILGSQVTDVKDTFFSSHETTEVLNSKGRLVDTVSSATLSGSTQLLGFQTAMRSIFKGMMLNVMKKASKSELKKDVYVHDAGNGVFIVYSTNNQTSVYSAISTKVFKPANDKIKDYIEGKLNKLDPNVDKEGVMGFNTLPSAIEKKLAGKKFVKFRPNKSMDIGHFYSHGSQLQGLEQAIKRVLPSLPEKDQKKIKELVSEAKATNKTARLNFGIDTEFHFEQNIVLGPGLIFDVKGLVVLSPESSGLNSGWFVREENKAKAELETSVRKIMNASVLLDTEGSKTLRQNLLGVLVEYQVNVVDDKTRGKRILVKAVRKGKKPAKVSTSFKHNKAKFDSGPLTVPTRKKGKKGGINGKPQKVRDVATNLTSITAIINEHLPIYLRANMGKGAANQILNWRSGRFGQSAQLKALVEVKGSRGLMIQGLVSYMRHPYDVFRPGRDQYKPGRDPKLLIDKSIRQIMRDKALSAMSFKSTLG